MSKCWKENNALFAVCKNSEVDQKVTKYKTKQIEITHRKQGDKCA